MLIARNQLRRRHRHRLAAILVAFLLCWLVIAAHSALAEHPGHDVAVCLALAETAALVLAVAMATPAPANAPLSRRWPAIDATSYGRATPSRPQPRSRAGPEFLQVVRQ